MKLMPKSFAEFCSDSLWILNAKIPTVKVIIANANSNTIP